MRNFLIGIEHEDLEKAGFKTEGVDYFRLNELQSKLQDRCEDKILKLLAEVASDMGLEKKDDAVTYNDVYREYEQEIIDAMQNKAYNYREVDLGEIEAISFEYDCNDVPVLYVHYADDNAILYRDCCDIDKDRVYDYVFYLVD